MYILILTVSYMYGVTATTAEFNSKEACEGALVAFKEKMEEVKTSSTRYGAFCTPKGTLTWTR